MSITAIEEQAAEEQVMERLWTGHEGLKALISQMKASGQGELAGFAEAEAYKLGTALMGIESILQSASEEGAA